MSYQCLKHKQNNLYDYDIGREVTRGRPTVSHNDINPRLALRCNWLYSFGSLLAALLLRKEHGCGYKQEPQRCRGTAMGQVVVYVAWHGQ